MPAGDLPGDYVPIREGVSPMDNRPRVIVLRMIAGENLFRVEKLVNEFDTSLLGRCIWNVDLRRLIQDGRWTVEVLAPRTETIPRTETVKDTGMAYEEDVSQFLGIKA